MVGVGGGVCEPVGRGVAVGKVESNGRQATSRHVIARSETTKQSPNRRVDCSLAPGASAGVVGPGLDTRFALLDHRPFRSDNTCKDFIKKY